MNLLSIALGLATFFFVCVRVLLFAILTRFQILKPVRKLLGLDDEEPTGYTLITKEFLLRKNTLPDEKRKRSVEPKDLKLVISKSGCFGNCSALQSVQLVDESDDNAIRCALMSKTGCPNVITRWALTRKNENQVNEGYFYKALYKLDEKQLVVDPAFEEKLAVVRKHAPRVYHFAETPFFCNFLLLMEDLTHQKYASLQEVKGASMEQCKLLVSALTKIHASFVGETANLRSYFPFLTQGVPITMHDPSPFMSIDLFDVWKKHGVPFTNEHEGADAVATKYQNLEAVIKWFSENRENNGKVKKLIEELNDKQTPQTLVHGDFRLDNSMIREHDNAIKLVDWQIPSISSPVVDIVYFLMWSAKSAEASNVTMEAFHEEILKHYYKELMANSNVASQYPEYTWNKFMHQVKTCVPFLVTQVAMMHLYPTPRVKLMIPINKKSLNTMIENWDIMNHIRTFIDYEDSNNYKM